MPQMRYIDVDGTKVLEFVIKDTKQEQELMAIFAKTQQPGFVTAHQWLPGVQNTDRADANRCVSRLRLFVAPVYAGKSTDLPQSEAQKPEPGKSIAKPGALEVPPELEAMETPRLLNMGPRIGAKVNPRMSRDQLIAALCLAIQRNPKNWEAIRPTLTTAVVGAGA